MRVRTWLLGVWGFFALLLWSLRDASRVALKYQVGGWHAAYIHLLMSGTYALLLAFVPVAIGWIVVLILRRKAN